MSDMVKVGSLLPGGITLRIAQWYKGPDDSPLVKDIATHTIAGSGQHIGHVPGNLHEEGADVPYTEIPADHWTSWLEMNKDNDLVKSGAVFEHKGDPDADKARDGEGMQEPTPISPLPPTKPMAEGEMEKVTRPEPTDVHDETYQQNFKDHVGQEEAPEPKLRGKSKEEVEGK